MHHLILQFNLRSNRFQIYLIIRIRARLAIKIANEYPYYFSRNLLKKNNFCWIYSNNQSLNQPMLMKHQRLFVAWNCQNNWNYQFIFFYLWIFFCAIYFAILVFYRIALCIRTFISSSLTSEKRERDSIITCLHPAQILFITW